MAIMRRQEDVLINRLEELLINGTCFIKWNELYVWFGQTKITKKTWREVWECWVRVVDKDGELAEVPVGDRRYKAWMEENKVSILERKDSGGITLIYDKWITGPLSEREYNP